MRYVFGCLLIVGLLVPVGARVPVFRWQGAPAEVSAVASPRGRYLAVSATRVPGGAGIWVRDNRTGRWRRVWTHTGEVQWIGEDGTLIVMTGSTMSDPYSGQRRDRVWSGFYRVSRTGRVEKFGILSHIIDWVAIPDGSGVVATRTAAEHETDGEDDIEVETLVYLFAQHRWRSCHRFETLFGGGGEDLAIRRHRGHWVISMSECLLGDNSAVWIDLTTNRVIRARGGDPYRFSPGGRFAVEPDGRYPETGSIYHAHSWPVSLPKGMGNAQPLAGKVCTFHMHGDYITWSPDARHIAVLVLPDPEGHVQASFALFDLQWTFALSDLTSC